MMRRSARPRAGAVATFVVGALLVTGCGDDGPAGPEGQFSGQITFEELVQGATSSGILRVEIELLPGTLVIRELEVEDEDDVSDPEEIESRITALEVSGDEGTVTLGLGELRVDFDRATGFRGSDDLTFDQFVQRVEAALADGRQPAVEAKRPARIPPQDPADASFLATRLELEDDEDEPEIEINIGPANLEPGSGTAEGFVRVLGLRLEVRSGVTEIEARPEGLVEFDGIVASVDLGGSSLTLTDGTAVRIVAETEVEFEDGLSSLEDVQAAVDAGLTVEAEGDGILVADSPRTIEAIEVEFELEDD